MNMQETTDNMLYVQPSNKDLQDLLYTENLKHQNVSKGKWYSKFSFDDISEEINSATGFEEKITVQGIPLVEYPEETKTILSTPKIKVKSLEELQNPQVYITVEQEELNKIPEALSNRPLMYSSAKKIYSTNNTDNSPLPKADKVLNTKNTYIKPSEHLDKKCNKISMLKKKENMLKEQLRKVLEIESFMGISPRKSKHSYNNKQAKYEEEALNSVDAGSDLKRSLLEPERVTSGVNKEVAQTKTSIEEFDITGLKDGIIEASRTLITTQKSLKMLNQMVSRHVILKDKQAIILLNQFKKILRTLYIKFDAVQKNVRNHYINISPQCNLNNLSKVVSESISTTKSCEMGPDKIFEIRKTDIIQTDYHKVPLLKEDGERIDDDHLLRSVKNNCVIPRTEHYYNLNKSKELKSIRRGRPPKDKRDVEEKCSNVGKPPKDKIDVIKFSRVCKSPKKRRYMDEEKTDKTFFLPGLSRKVDSALRRVVPARTCRKSRSYDFDEEEPGSLQS